MKNLAVIFDMDGVIVDDIPFHLIAWRQFLESKGIEMSKDKFERDYNGRTFPEILKSVFNKNLTKKEISRLHGEKEHIFHKIFQPHLKLLPGLKIFLDEIKEKNIPIGLATAGHTDNVNYILNGTNIMSYFDTIVDACDVSLGKPDPTIYNLTIEQMGVDPKYCVVFEDSLNGIDAAKTAGTKVIGVATTMKKSELSEADLVIKDFTEISIEKVKSLI